MDLLRNTNSKVLKTLEREVVPPKRPDEDLLTSDERTEYMSAVGSLIYATTWSRWDLAADVNFRAQKNASPTVADMKSLAKLAREAVETKEQPITLTRGQVDLQKMTLVCWGDAAFANAECERSQCGVVIAATSDPGRVVGECRFDLCQPLWGQSSTVKRVVSTLAAEGCAISEASETLQYLRQMVCDLSTGCKLNHGELSRRASKAVVLTDFDNLAKTVSRDVGAVTDKRLRIVVSALRQDFQDPNGNLHLQWAPTHLMLADALTKSMTKDMVRAFMSAKAHKPSVPNTKRGLHASRTLTAAVIAANIAGTKAEEMSVVPYTEVEISDAFSMIKVVVLLGFVAVCMFAAAWWLRRATRPVDRVDDKSAQEVAAVAARSPDKGARRRGTTHRFPAGQRVRLLAGGGRRSAIGVTGQVQSGEVRAGWLDIRVEGTVDPSTVIPWRIGFLEAIPHVDVPLVPLRNDSSGPTRGRNPKRVPKPQPKRVHGSVVLPRSPSPPIPDMLSRTLGVIPHAAVSVVCFSALRRFKRLHCGAQICRCRCRRHDIVTSFRLAFVRFSAETRMRRSMLSVMVLAIALSSS